MNADTGLDDAELISRLSEAFCRQTLGLTVLMFASRTFMPVSTAWRTRWRECERDFMS
jgi:hypothetical protein